MVVFGILFTLIVIGFGAGMIAFFAYLIVFYFFWKWASKKQNKNITIYINPQEEKKGTDLKLIKGEEND